MTQRFFKIAEIGNGKLYIGPRPRRSTLDEWCEALAKIGISHVVSLIGRVEVEEYSLAGEHDALAASGITFRHFPIDDYGAPKSPRYHELVMQSQNMMENGKSVFAHCAGGVGRAGTFASCLLVADGMDADQAMRLVSDKRGANAPESDGQRAFVRGFTP